MSKKCSLCGGRLQEGVCVECGLDNTKNDSKRKQSVEKRGEGKKNLL